MAAVSYAPGMPVNYPVQMSPMMVVSMASPVREPPQPWRSNLCSCMDDPASCCMAWCFPCVLFGQNAEKIDGSGCFCNCCLYAVCMWYGCQCLVHAGKRTALRMKYNLRPQPCDDCLMACCCPCCALSQEARELLARTNDGPPQQLMTTMVMSPHGGASVGSPTTINVHTNNNNNSPPHYSTPNSGPYANNGNGAMAAGQQGGAPANYDNNNPYANHNYNQQYANNGNTFAQPVKQFNYTADGTGPTLNDYQPAEAYRISAASEGQAGTESPYANPQVLKTL